MFIVSCWACIHGLPHSGLYPHVADSSRLLVVLFVEGMWRGHANTCKATGRCAAVGVWAWPVAVAGCVGVMQIAPAGDRGRASLRQCLIDLNAFAMRPEANSRCGGRSLNAWGLVLNIPSRRSLYWSRLLSRGLCHWPHAKPVGMVGPETYRGRAGPWGWQQAVCWCGLFPLAV